MQPFFIIVWIIYALLMYVVFKVGAARPHSKELMALAESTDPAKVEAHIRRSGIYVLTPTLFIVCLAYVLFNKFLGGF